MGSAIGPAFTYLLAGVPAVIAAIDPAAAVVDGWTNVLPDDFMVIGRGSDADQTQASGMDAYVLLGGAMLDEEFTIPCYIDCFRGGDNQAEARNAALAYFNAFVKFLATDLTLGGALGNGRYARMDAIHIDGPVLEDAADGRRCVISFTVRCQNQYDPHL